MINIESIFDAVELEEFKDAQEKIKHDEDITPLQSELIARYSVAVNNDTQAIKCEIEQINDRISELQMLLEEEAAKAQSILDIRLEKAHRRFQEYHNGQ